MTPRLIPMVVLLGIVSAIPAKANCYTVPDWRTGLERVICQPDSPAAVGSTIDPSIPLQAGQNLPHFGPDLGQGQRGLSCVTRQIGSAVYTNCR